MNQRLAIAATLLLALLLTILPMPTWAEAWRPAWLLMVLCYWCLALPDRCNLTTAWCTGLILDVLQDGVLGVWALTLTIIAYLAIREHRRVRMYSLGQQALLLGLVLLPVPYLQAWTQGISGHVPRLGGGLASTLVSVLLWPWVFIVLRDLRRRCR